MERRIETERLILRTVTVEDAGDDMRFEIERINEEHYPGFDDMVFWRENGYEREPSQMIVPEQIRKELSNPNLYIYAASADKRYVGWISLVYIPKVGRWKGSGHVYVDELWVAPDYRRQSLGKELMKKADDLVTELGAAGIRLYVNVDNPGAQALYEFCGYQENGKACLMEKSQML